MLQMFPQVPIMNYLKVEMPPYPTPVEFWISNATHVTKETTFEKILETEEFRPRVREFSWWGLKIKKEEIRAAEQRYMERHFPNQAQGMKEILEKFTKSPPFNLERSRYGNYRFAFPFIDLTQSYKEQNCGGEEPVLRVHETVTYKQEIMLTVLIHSPEHNQRFREYPLLEASEWVRYQDGQIIWKAQAMCGTHEYQFVSGDVQRLDTLMHYVWDQVCLVFHLPKSKSLKIPSAKLIEALDACEIDEVDLTGSGGRKDRDERFRNANIRVSVK